MYFDADKLISMFVDAAPKIIVALVVGLVTWLCGKAWRRWFGLSHEISINHVQSLFKHNEHSFSRKIWRLETYKIGPMEEVWTPLSAAIADRISSTIVEKHLGTLRRGRRIRNLNRFLRSKRAQHLLFALTGPPGSGKTFELIKLYQDIKKAFRSEKDWIPLLIFANELPAGAFSHKDSDYEVRDFVLRYLQECKYPSDVIDYLGMAFYNLRFMILLDGLDELPEKAEYDDAMRRLADRFIPEIQQHGWRLIVSSRGEDYDSRLRLVELELQPLSAAQIERFFTKRITTSLGKRRRQAWYRLTARDMGWFEPYRSNPYFLALMIDSIEEVILDGSQDPPANLRELFQKTIRRELLKVKAPNDIINTSVERSFEASMSLIAHILIEKTLNGEEAIVSLRDPSDRERLFNDAFRLAASVEPFMTITQCGANTGGDQAAFLAELRILLGRDLADEVRELFAAVHHATTLEHPELVRAAVGLVVERMVSLGVERRLLRVREGDAEIVLGFRHRRIMEYLAALFLDRVKASFEEKINNLWYKQTLCMLAAITDDAGWLLSSLAASGPESMLLAVEVAVFLHPSRISTAGTRPSRSC